MKKWIIAASIGTIGLILLGIAAKLNGDLDAYHLSLPGPHGQFTGAGQEFLIAFFFMFLMAVSLLAGVATAIGVILKWRSIALVRVRYANLLYWTLCIPLVLYILCFPAWALWHTIGGCMEFLW